MEELGEGLVNEEGALQESVSGNICNIKMTIDNFNDLLKLLMEQLTRSDSPILLM